MVSMCCWECSQPQNSKTKLIYTSWQRTITMSRKHFRWTVFDAEGNYIFHLKSLLAIVRERKEHSPGDWSRDTLSCSAWRSVLSAWKAVPAQAVTPTIKQVQRRWKALRQPLRAFIWCDDQTRRSGNDGRRAGESFADFFLRREGEHDGEDERWRQKWRKELSMVRAPCMCFRIVQLLLCYITCYA
eukprot:m.85389 g.85389  ORF g.85389 m.85389 type:complete len:186 (+) comp12780_c0_seq1:239-796(+)